MKTKLLSLLILFSSLFCRQKPSQKVKFNTGFFYHQIDNNLYVRKAVLYTLGITIPAIILLSGISANLLTKVIDQELKDSKGKNNTATATQTEKSQSEFYASNIDILEKQDKTKEVCSEYDENISEKEGLEANIKDLNENISNLKKDINTARESTKQVIADIKSIENEITKTTHEINIELPTKIKDTQEKTKKTTENKEQLEPQIVEKEKIFRQKNAEWLDIRGRCNQEQQSLDDIETEMEEKKQQLKIQQQQKLIATEPEPRENIRKAEESSRENLRNLNKIGLGQAFEKAKIGTSKREGAQRQELLSSQEDARKEICNTQKKEHQQILDFIREKSEFLESVQKAREACSLQEKKGREEICNKQNKEHQQILDFIKRQASEKTNFVKSEEKARSNIEREESSMRKQQESKVVENKKPRPMPKPEQKSKSWWSW